jgi:PTS system fructose-specific IIC component
MAATMAAGMTPPLGIAVAALIFRGRFSRVERNESKVASIMGLSFITEGAIPYAARDPLRAIPCFMAGSAVTGAISMVMGCGIMVPHGGAFVLLIPNAVTNLRAYVLAIVCGALLTGLLLGLVKRKPLQA